MDVLSKGSGGYVAQEYDAWGVPQDTEGLDLTRTGYTSHQHDVDLGLIDMRGRVYDELAGRFTTPDPIMQAPYFSQGLNRYAYVFNDPVNNVDPSGFMSAYGHVEGASPGIAAAHFTVPAALSTLSSNGGVSGASAAVGSAGIGANVATTLLSGSLGGGSRAASSYSVAPSAAPAAQGAAQGGTHAVGQNSAQPGPELADWLWEKIENSPDYRIAGNLEWAHLYTGGTMENHVRPEDGPVIILGSAAMFALYMAPEVAAVLSTRLAAVLSRLAPSILPSLPVVRSAAPKLQEVSRKFGVTAEVLLRRVAESAYKLKDMRSGNINLLLARLDGKSGYIRVTLDPGANRIISAGLVKARSFVNAVKSGRFVPLL